MQSLSDILTKAPRDAPLADLDPRDFRAYSDWFSLMVRCFYGGVDCEDFVSWSVQDPEYSGDAEKIRKHWGSLGR